MIFRWNFTSFNPFLVAVFFCSYLLKYSFPHWDISHNKSRGCEETFLKISKKFIVAAKFYGHFKISEIFTFLLQQQLWPPLLKSKWPLKVLILVFYHYYYLFWTMKFNSNVKTSPVPRKFEKKTPLNFFSRFLSRFAGGPKIFLKYFQFLIFKFFCSLLWFSKGLKEWALCCNPKKSYVDSKLAFKKVGTKKHQFLTKSRNFLSLYLQNYMRYEAEIFRISFSHK